MLALVLQAQEIQTTWYKDVPTLASIAVAFATLVYVGVSIYLLKATKRIAQITQDTFEASNRPYLGVNELSPSWQGTRLDFRAEVINYGSVPAKLSKREWWIDSYGERIFTDCITDKTVILLPQTPYTIKTSLKNADSLPDGIASLKIQINVAYKGITNKTYNHSEIYRYDNSGTRFIKDSGESD